VICRLYRQAPEKKSDKISFSTSGITSLSLAIEQTPLGNNFRGVILRGRHFGFLLRFIDILWVKNVPARQNSSQICSVVQGAYLLFKQAKKKTGGAGFPL
jgi:hypothetical protein